MWPGPYGEFGSRKYLLASLDQSLGRLGLDYVDIFYSHRPDPETPVEETMGALATAVRQGKALYVGISNYGPEQTRAAAAALEAEGVPLLIHQPRYSMFDRHIEDGLFPALEEVGAASIVFSPLAQGLLTDRYLSGRCPGRVPRGDEPVPLRPTASAPSTSSAPVPSTRSRRSAGSRSRSSRSRGCSGSRSSRAR